MYIFSCLRVLLQECEGFIGRFPRKNARPLSSASGKNRAKIRKVTSDAWGTLTGTVGCLVAVINLILAGSSPFTVG